MRYFELPDSFYQVISQPNTVLLHTSKKDHENAISYLFTHPIKIIEAQHFGELEKSFQQIDKAIQQGYYVAGYMVYEAGFYFHPKLHSIVQASQNQQPLLWYGVYDFPIEFNHKSGEIIGAGCLNHSYEKQKQDSHYQLGEFKLNISKPEYSELISEIKSEIRAGNIYQLNFTTRLEFDFRGNPIGLYRALVQQQPVAYGAYIHTETCKILSFSPELFFKKKQQWIQTRPMKGTVRRGLNAKEDEALKVWLKQDEKNRAENLMIVDLLRNDLGRICEPHSIRVPEIFQLQTYPSLHQMISKVEGRLKENISTREIFEALFPCGSITGAPKIKSMELIHQFEKSQRGVYTGSIGFISPTGEAEFNVAIRTLTLKAHQGELGIGSGVVWDSDAQSEYEECLLKAQFLSQTSESVKLIETMLWDSGFPLLERHLKRLMHSASCLNFSINPDFIRNALAEEAKSFRAGECYKVRLLCCKQGEIKIESTLLAKQTPNPKVCLSRTPMHSSNTYLFHKTTHRDSYNTTFKKAQALGYSDALWFNEHKYLTEGCITNVFLKKENHFLTPAIGCGLLPGVYREKMLEEHPDCDEAKLTLDDLKSAESLFICNAVRGLVEVGLEMKYIEDM